VQISEKCDGDPGIDYIRIRTRKQEPYNVSLNSPISKKARQMRSKVTSMLIIFFDFKEIVHKEFLIAGQTVNSAYCRDVSRRLREDVRRLSIDFGGKK
jgi:hypothetical protein